MKALFVGPYPPPVTGMSSVNKNTSELLTACDYEIDILDTCQSSLNRKITSRFQRIPIVIKNLLVYMDKIKKNEVDFVYLSLSGGLALVYDLIFVVLAKKKNIPCILHHHNWTYLHKKFFLMKILSKVSNKRNLHIALCPEMKNKLERIYLIKNCHVLSNSIQSLTQKYNPRTTLRKVGFISNLTEEKGIFTYINVAAVLKKKHPNLKFVVAGGCNNASVEKALLKASDLGIIEWLGAIYGKEKEKFFSITDVILFPTEYKNEAEPLIIWEAFSNSIPVISNDTGCIRDQIKGTTSSICPSGEEFISHALKVVTNWLENPNIFREASLKAYQKHISSQYSKETIDKLFRNHLNLINK